jgi:hypothetical protein
MLIEMLFLSELQIGATFWAESAHEAKAQVNTPLLRARFLP